MGDSAKRLVIIGASAMGRETCAYAMESGIAVKGFLDSRMNLLSDMKGYPPILGPADDYKIEKSDVFICAVGDPKAKCQYVEMIEGKGGKFVSVVHPTAYIGMNVQIGNGCVVAPHVSISNDTIVGNHVIVNLNASISHDNRISDGCTICPGCHLAGWVTLGKKVFVGIGVSVIPHVSLGEGVFVAAGAVVTKSFSSGCLMGIPAIPRGSA